MTDSNVNMKPVERIVQAHNMMVMLLKGALHKKIKADSREEWHATALYHALAWVLGMRRGRFFDKYLREIEAKGKLKWRRPTTYKMIEGTPFSAN